MNSETDQLTILLERKLDLLEQLRDLGTRQLESIEVSDMSQLMKILSGKQRMLQELQSIEHGLDPFRQQTPEERRWKNEAERQRCVQLNTRCQLLFSEIVAQERNSEQRLIVERDEAERRLQGMHHSMKAHGAYVSEGSTQFSSLDFSTEG